MSNADTKAVRSVVMRGIKYYPVDTPAGFDGKAKRSKVYCRSLNQVSDIRARIRLWKTEQGKVSQRHQSRSTWSKKTSKNQTSWIYFLKSGQFVKIGFSEDIVTRLSSHLCSNPNAELIAIIAGSQLYEAALHSKFKHLQHEREWFRLEGELLTFVSSIETLKQLNSEERAA